METLALTDFIAGRAAIVGVSKQQSPPNSRVIRAFIETGSDSRLILSQLSESNLAENVRSVFCGPRTFGGNKGVLVTVCISTVVPNNASVTLVLIQEGAQRYQEPVLYTGS